MRIECEEAYGKWVIVRGNPARRIYFSFFVDSDRSSWTRRSWVACKFQTHAAAVIALKELRNRDRQRRPAAGKAGERT